eukprot:929176_1
MAMVKTFRWILLAVCLYGFTVQVYGSRALDPNGNSKISDNFVDFAAYGVDPPPWEYNGPTADETRQAALEKQKRDQDMLEKELKWVREENQRREREEKQK